MKNLMRRLWKEEDGQDLVEYGLLVVLIALTCVTAMNTLATTINTALFNKAGGALTT